MFDSFVNLLGCGPILIIATKRLAIAGKAKLIFKSFPAQSKSAHLGDRDMEANAISVRVHGKGNLGAKPRDDAIAELLASVKKRRA